MVIQETICSLFQLTTTYSNCSTMPLDKLLIEYLLVPSVIMIIFLYIAATMFLKSEHPKIKPLLAIVFYIVIVYTGFYGIFAAFVMPYLVLFLIGAFVLFVVTRFMPISDWLSLAKSARGFGEKTYDTKIIKDRIDVKEGEIIRLKERKKAAEDKKDQEQMSIINALITEAEMELELYKKQLKRSEKIIPR